MLRTYPLFMIIEGQPILLVGGGSIAEKKADALLAAGADLTVVAPTVTDQIRKWADTSRIAHRSRPYRDGDLEGASLVVVATDDNELNTHISELCRARRIPVNVVDVPELCTFVIPSVVHRGDLTIAVSAGASAPTLARHLCDDLEKIYGHEYTAYTALLREERRRTVQEIKFKTAEERRAFFEQMLELPLLDLIREGKTEEARQKLWDLIESEKARRSGRS